jgi:hypothetical protein
VDEGGPKEPQALPQVRHPHRKERRLSPHVLRKVQDSHLLALSQGTEIAKFRPHRHKFLKIYYS